MKRLIEITKRQLLNKGIEIDSIKEATTDYLLAREMVDKSGYASEEEYVLFDCDKNSLSFFIIPIQLLKKYIDKAIADHKTEIFNIIVTDEFFYRANSSFSCAEHYDSLVNFIQASITKEWHTNWYIELCDYIRDYAFMHFGEDAILKSFASLTSKGAEEILEKANSVFTEAEAKIVGEE